MTFDFFDDEKDFELGKTFPKSEKRNVLKRERKKRTFEKTYNSRDSVCSNSIRTNVSGDSTFSNPQIHASVDASCYSSLSQSSETRSMKSHSSSVSIQRDSRHLILKTGQQQEEDSCSNDDDLSFLSQSQNNSSRGAYSTSDFTRNSLSTVNSYIKTKRKRLLVCRGAGSSVHAVQDAGTHQMIHDECSYLCSTILSKTTRSSKTIDAAIELATLLSCRKRRSMLWQGGTHDRNGSDLVENYNKRSGSSSGKSYLGSTEEMKKQSQIPKVWSSIFEVLALAATIDTFSDSDSSSNFSYSSATTKSPIKARPTLSSTKHRTKSARRKEKKYLETNNPTTSTIEATTKKHISDSSKGIFCHFLKDVLACIFHFVSWDCTMSREHSIAAMGAVKSCAIARRIRLAVLERGTALKGIIRLMAPSRPLATNANTQNNDSSMSTLHATTCSLPKRFTSKKKKSLSSSVSSSHNFSSGFPSITRQVKMLYSSRTRDPTAMGRRRKNRRESNETSFLSNSPQINGTGSTLQPEEIEKESEKRKNTPSPPNRCVASLCRRDHGSDELSFDDFSTLNQPYKKFENNSIEGDRRSSTISGTSAVETSALTSHLLLKVDALRTKIFIESKSIRKNKGADNAEVPFAPRADSNEAICFGRKFANNSTYIEGDRPWLSIVCLESLTRMLTGKELHGKTSCLEDEETSEGTEEKDSDGIDQNNTNIVIVTNRMVGSSGVIPLLSFAMSQSMELVTKLLFSTKCQKVKNAMNTSFNLDDEYWNYCHNRLKLLASLIDEACFFSERNRRNFCEDDPFSFQDEKKGLVFHILIFLHECSKCDLSHPDQQRSEIMSLALRTLTSLTHDNALAAKQMENFNHYNLDSNDDSDSEKTIQGICILARLAFELEESPLLNPLKLRISDSMHVKSVSDHDMHRYDSTIFCFTTLANITEGADIGKILMGIEVELKDGKKMSWVEWLCHWLIKQTETFRQEILSIGKSKKRNIGYFSAATTNDAKKDLQQEDEEKLVAAGNGCVVLACLIIESEDRDPDFSTSMKNLIKKKMPLSSDGSPSGLSLVVNTLKAYCNYYQISMGGMSAAVVSPIRRLIGELDEIVKIDRVPQL